MGAINIPSLRDPFKQQFDRVTIDTVAAHHKSDQRILDQVGEGAFCDGFAHDTLPTP
jgi:hypothetical protein